MITQESSNVVVLVSPPSEPFSGAVVVGNYDKSQTEWQGVIDTFLSTALQSFAPGDLVGVYAVQPFGEYLIFKRVTDEDPVADGDIVATLLPEASVGVLCIHGTDFDDTIAILSMHVVNPELVLATQATSSGAIVPRSAMNMMNLYLTGLLLGAMKVQS